MKLIKVSDKRFSKYTFRKVTYARTPSKLDEYIKVFNFCNKNIIDIQQQHFQIMLSILLHHSLIIVSEWINKQSCLLKITANIMLWWNNKLVSFVNIWRAWHCHISWKWKQVESVVERTFLLGEWEEKWNIVILASTLLLNKKSLLNVITFGLGFTFHTHR